MASLQMRRAAGVFVGIAMFVVAAWSGSDSSSLQTQFFGMGSYEFGQIVKGQYAWATSPGSPNGRLFHYWQQQSLMQMGYKAKRSNGFSVVLAGEGAMYFPYTKPSDGAGFGYEQLSPKFKWYIHEAAGSYSMGDQDVPFLRVEAGFFPFKYNPDARNFGEYLFRINSYPQYLPTSFDAAYQRLLGLHLSSTQFTSFKQDLFLTSEVYLWPLRDFSLSYLASYNVLQFADIGAGIMGDRMFSVQKDLTTPPPNTQSNHNLTFTSTKVMVRLALDFKRFLPCKELWGKNDWRLYSEACFNGLKNYKEPDSLGGSPNPLAPGYDDIKKRLPVLYGFNVPTCKILDVLSFEAEWWNNDFANSYLNVYPILQGYQEPPWPSSYNVSLQTGRRIDPYGGRWHWSIYAKKTIFDNIKITAQAARDHTILATSLTGAANGDPEEAMDGKGNWAWMCKVEYGF